MPHLLLQAGEVYWLGEELEGSKVTGPAAPIVVAIGSHYHHWQVGPAPFDLVEQF